MFLKWFIKRCKKWNIWRRFYAYSMSDFKKVLVLFGLKKSKEFNNFIVK